MNESAVPPMHLTPDFLVENEGELSLELLRFELHPVHQALTYQFRMIHSETREVLGNMRLSLGNTAHLERYAGHIGYGVLPEHRGHRYAVRAVRLILPFAFSAGLDPVWITCDPENLASRRTLELAGAELIEIADVPEDCVIHKSGHPKKCRYRIELNPSGSGSNQA